MPSIFTKFFIRPTLDKEGEEASCPSEDIPSLSDRSPWAQLDCPRARESNEIRLHTDKEPNDLEIPTGTSLVLFVLDIFQKERHIVIRYLQVNWAMGNLG